MNHSANTPAPGTPGADLSARLDRFRRLALLVGGVAVAALVVLGLIPGLRASIFRPYLVGYAFWFGITMGGIGLTMLHHLTSGAWGLLIRRPLEAAAMTVLPMAALFIPIAIGLFSGGDVLYPWTDLEVIRGNQFVAHKVGWLNPTAFLLRTALYFAIWIVAAFLLNRWSAQQDRSADHGPSSRLSYFSGPMLALTFLTITFATFDWMMSLEPDWYSSIYGAMLICGWALTTFSFTVIVSQALARQDAGVARVATPQQFNDLGNLMLATTMLWAYTSFMQFLIIWSGNLAEEIPWYLRRSRGGWEFFVAALMIFHFFAPFLVLLMRDIKRRPHALRWVAGGILAIHLVDMMWLILPSQFRDPLATGPSAVYVPWFQVLLAVASAIGIGGIWLAFFVTQLMSKPLVPVNDPAVDRIPIIVAAASHGHGA